MNMNSVMARTLGLGGIVAGVGTAAVSMAIANNDSKPNSLEKFGGMTAAAGPSVSRAQLPE